MRKVQSGTSSLLFKLLVCILTVSAQRHQPRRLAEVDIETLLARITATLQDAWTAPVPVGYAFWRSDTSGWGNQCRGMSAMLGFALLSGRKLIFTSSPEVPSAVYFDIFDEPSNSFSINANRVKLSDLNTKGAWRGTGGQLGKPVEAYSELVQAALDSNGSVSHPCGCSFTSVLTTEAYADRWEKLLGARLRADEIEVLLLMWLFQNPKPAMLAAVEKVKQQVGWASYSYHVAIQYRSWIDVKPFAPLRAESEARTLSCALEELHSLRLALPEPRVLVYITSDDPLFAQKVAHTLGALPNITYASSPLLDRRHSAKYSKAGPRDMTVNVGVVDWFLLGEAAAALCTGTTFCTSARARTGVGRSDWGLVGGVGAVGGAGGVGGDSHRAPFDAFEKNQGNRQLLSQVTLVCPRAGTHTLAPAPTHMPMYNNSISRPDLPLPWFVSTVMEKSVEKGYVGKVWSAI